LHWLNVNWYTKSYILTCYLFLSRCRLFGCKFSVWLNCDLFILWKIDIYTRKLTAINGRRYPFDLNFKYHHLKETVARTLISINLFTTPSSLSNHDLRNDISLQIHTFDHTGSSNILTFLQSLSQTSLTAFIIACRKCRLTNIHSQVEVYWYSFKIYKLTIIL